MRKFGIITLCLLAIFGLARAADVENPFRPPATTCTNQFIRSLAAITGVGTCATVALATDTSGTLPAASLQFNPGSIYNCTLVGTVAANALTVAIKTQTGADPSASNPCVISFRNVTPATGDYTAVQVTAATSFATATSGSTFGATNNNPFRLWITAINNAGTVVLGVSNQSSTIAVFPLNEGVAQSSTACNACGTATAIGTIYSTAAQTSKMIRILGYMDWTAGLATAGTFASGPTNIQLMGPGTKRPGDIVQVISAVNSQTTAFNNTTQTPTNLTVSITPTSSVNRVMVDASGVIEPATQNVGFNAQLSRTNTPILIGNIATVYDNIGAGAIKMPGTMIAFDAPVTQSAVAYFVFIVCSTTCSGNWNVDAVQAVIRVYEIMS